MIEPRSRGVLDPRLRGDDRLWCFSTRRHCERSEAIHPSTRTVWIASSLALLAMTGREPRNHTGSAIEYFTWLNAKLDSMDAMPSSRVSLVFRNAS
ncbi:hypothetical protein V1277_004768 [Bradyrhizobium sp. AZCC 1588]